MSLMLVFYMFRVAMRYIASNNQLKRDWFSAELQTSPLAGRYI